jgi:hypothetical protein
MPMSIEELELSYRRAYRRLSIGIGVAYAVIVLAGLVTMIGNPGLVSWISAAVQVSPSVPEPMRFAPAAKRILTVKND